MKNNNIVIVGQCIAQRRTELGLSQKELAKKINVGTGTLSRWETGVVERIRRGNFGKLCCALNVNADYLLDESAMERSILEHNNAFTRPLPIDGEDPKLFIQRLNNWAIYQ